VLFLSQEILTLHNLHTVLDFFRKHSRFARQDKRHVIPTLGFQLKIHHISLAAKGEAKAVVDVHTVICHCFNFSTNASKAIPLCADPSFNNQDAILHPL
jgi:hypothetical protein